MLRVIWPATNFRHHAVAPVPSRLDAVLRRRGRGTPCTAESAPCPGLAATRIWISEPLSCVRALLHSLFHNCWSATVGFVQERHVRRFQVDAVIDTGDLTALARPSRAGCPRAKICPHPGADPVSGMATHDSQATVRAERASAPHHRTQTRPNSSRSPALNVFGGASTPVHCPPRCQGGQVDTSDASPTLAPPRRAWGRDVHRICHHLPPGRSCASDEARKPGGGHRRQSPADPVRSHASRSTLIYSVRGCRSCVTPARPGGAGTLL